MFVFQLRGGLGNQLFQYAAARALCIRRNTWFKVHFSDPDPTVKRRFALHPFPVMIHHATAEDLAHYKPLSVANRVAGLLGKKVTRYPVYEEQQDFLMDPGFFSCPDNSYMSGFWQTPDYFRDIWDVLSPELTLQKPPVGSNASWLEHIQQSNSVAIHVRRGDFASVPRTREIHGICGVDYYHEAINFTQSRLIDPVYYIFSEDPEWVRANVAVLCERAHVVDSNLASGQEYEDLRLISACKHQVISNSTFSWWAAWLNPNRDKIVIAPKTWLNYNGLHTHSLLPADWIRL